MSNVNSSEKEVIISVIKNFMCYAVVMATADEKAFN
jgi:hypothetical protein